MRVSIVTISFNQAEFLETAILSVLAQDYEDLEYIVVDPGSTDGSRGIINQYASKISKVILKPDKGPADGLNKGFSEATGFILGFLNSDDVLLPGAISKVVSAFRTNDTVDVISGHSVIVDESGHELRRCYSDPYTALRAAYNAAFLMQPSTFFKAEQFFAVGGFNVENKSNWDGELWLDFYQNGASFSLVNEFLSCYRLTASSITGSQKLDALIKDFHQKKFKRVLNRHPSYWDTPVFWGLKMLRMVNQPRHLYQKIFNGKVYGRKVVS